ncbi:MAG: hypothetical protein E6H10_17690 [Bacteroidetes bacterium]|nr:MAG: hypothetical protein E6H10_17690 [Bacteroidota bacterium]
MDFNEVLAEMAQAIKGVVKEDWSVVKSTANDFLQDSKQRWQLLVSMRLNNEISEDNFKQRLKNEELILESNLHAIAIITKAAAQAAANAAIAVLEKAVNTLLRIP